MDPDFVKAAQAVIIALKDVQEFKECRVIIIRGLALQNHVPGFRKANDVDILILHPDNAVNTSDIKADLREKKVLEELAQPLFYKHIPSLEIQVDIIPQDLVPYIPAGTVALKDVDPAHIPILSAVDLLAYKIHCCSMRPEMDKRKQDAKDAVALVRALPQQGPVRMTESQKDAVLSGIDYMIPYCGKSKSREWWKAALGI